MAITVFPLRLGDIELDFWSLANGPAGNEIGFLRLAGSRWVREHLHLDTGLRL